MDENKENDRLSNENVAKISKEFFGRKVEEDHAAKGNTAGITPEDKAKDKTINKEVRKPTLKTKVIRVSACLAAGVIIFALVNGKTLNTVKVGYQKVASAVTRQTDNTKIPTMTRAQAQSAGLISSKNNKLNEKFSEIDFSGSAELSTNSDKLSQVDANIKVSSTKESTDNKRNIYGTEFYVLGNGESNKYGIVGSYSHTEQIKNEGQVSVGIGAGLDSTGTVHGGVALGVSSPIKNKDSEKDAKNSNSKTKDNVTQKTKDTTLTVYGAVEVAHNVPNNDINAKVTIGGKISSGSVKSNPVENYDFAKFAKENRKNVSSLDQNGGGSNDGGNNGGNNGTTQDQEIPTPIEDGRSL